MNNWMDVIGDELNKPGLTWPSGNGGLQIRAYSVLCGRYGSPTMGMRTPEEIRRMTDRELLKLKGCGKATLRAIRQAFPYKPKD